MDIMIKFKEEIEEDFDELYDMKWLGFLDNNGVLVKEATIISSYINAYLGKPETYHPSYKITISERNKIVISTYPITKGNRKNYRIIREFILKSWRSKMSDMFLVSYSVNKYDRYSSAKIIPFIEPILIKKNIKKPTN